MSPIAHSTRSIKLVKLLVVQNISKEFTSLIKLNEKHSFQNAKHFGSLAYYKYCPWCGNRYFVLSIDCKREQSIELGTKKKKKKEKKRKKERKKETRRIHFKSSLRHYRRYRARTTVRLIEGLIRRPCSCGRKYLVGEMDIFTNPHISFSHSMLPTSERTTDTGNSKHLLQLQYKTVVNTGRTINSLSTA
jgi:hypothetical protein